MLLAQVSTARICAHGRATKQLQVARLGEIQGCQSAPTMCTQAIINRLSLLRMLKTQGRLLLSIMMAAHFTATCKPRLTEAQAVAKTGISLSHRLQPLAETAQGCCRCCKQITTSHGKLHLRPYTLAPANSRLYSCAIPAAPAAALWPHGHTT